MHLDFIYLFSSSTYISKGTFLRKEVGLPTLIYMMWQGFHTNRYQKTCITWESHGIIQYARLDICMFLHVYIHVSIAFWRAL